jgi:hypothetical protein
VSGKQQYASAFFIGISVIRQSLDLKVLLKVFALKPQRPTDLKNNLSEIFKNTPGKSFNFIGILFMTKSAEFAR